MASTDTCALCCIALDEELYIDEWIQYHLKIGFDAIHVYDNSENNVLSFLENRYQDSVYVVHYQGRCMQIPAYNHFVQVNRDRYRWCAMMDIDEFLVLRKHKSVKELLKEHCIEGALSLNWIFFGTNGHEKFINEPVLKRFTKRQTGVNQQVKTISCMDDIDYYENPHFPVLKSNRLQHDCDGNFFSGALNSRGTEEIACIYHYFLKSKEEFGKKIARGRADIPDFRTWEADFELHDLNDYEDLSAWIFFMYE
jgi:Glycosyl transferase family 2